MACKIGRREQGHITSDGHRCKGTTEYKQYKGSRKGKRKAVATKACGRPRQVRRLARLGVHVLKSNIRPTSKSARSSGSNEDIDECKLGAAQRLAPEQPLFRTLVIKGACASMG